MKSDLIFALAAGMLLSGIMVGMLRQDWATLALIVGGGIGLVLAGLIANEPPKRPGARP